MYLLFNIIPAFAVAVSTNLLAQSVLVLQLWYFVLTRKFFSFKNDFAIHFSYNGKEITYYLRHVMDVAVLREVYVNKEYEWFPVQDPKVIVDLGAHFGDTTLYYHAQFPEACIIAVEPAPENFARLQKHVAGIKNIICLNAAVGSSNGTIKLNIGKSSLGHSVVKRSESDTEIEVPLMTLESILVQAKATHIDLVKFDIEGAEFDAFRDVSQNKKFTSFIGELHFDLSDNQDIESFQQNFPGFTFALQEIKKDRYIIKGSHG
jgi:FkbM family methyltransferase